ncbi:hypothetical protein CEXT_324221 [Caerostris extrusa]|uniref:Uncharacterized protein n=1 Tax=Caerostris extrusa TaxID=172846 RepID=A0AAV4Y5P4_CAEEX|nr:hypothetical protein CEXT_324221 [Caerostris extrusa]
MGYMILKLSSEIKLFIFQTEGEGSLLWGLILPNRDVLELRLLALKKFSFKASSISAALMMTGTSLIATLRSLLDLEVNLK